MSFFRSVTNPLFASALLVSLLRYSGVVRVRPGSLSSLIEPSSIVSVRGVVESAPKRIRGGSYMIPLRCTSVSSRRAVSSASGAVSIIVPARIIDSRSPGGIFTSARGSPAPLVDAGLSVEASVSAWNPYGGGSFRSESIRDCGGWGRGIPGALRRARAEGRRSFRRLLASWGDAGGLLLALLSGMRDGTSPVLAENFRRAGLSHILALSGMHMSLFGGAASAAGGIFGRRAGRFFSLAAVVGFAWFAGLSPSLLRALFFVAVPFVAGAFRLREPDGLALLSLSFLIHSAAVPEHVAEVSFMLSYSSLLGITLLSGAFRSAVSPVIRVPWISSSISASAAAFVATAPVSVLVFGYASPVGIVSTPVVAPLVVAFIVLGAVSFAASLAAPFLSPFFGGIMNAMYSAVFGASAFFAGLSGLP